jgi:bifunctional UDP-N-acetylglucosamine pyrophosphorylase/glucosamine-1-phosphate N-acetyltransferase
LNYKKAAVVLAAGKGKRMMSDLPKVLHSIKGKPIIRIILDTLTNMSFDRIIVVIGHEGEQVQQALRDYDVEFAWQREQLGTGHAVMMTSRELKDFEGITLVAAGDVPFLSKQSINHLLKTHSGTGAAATCLSAIFEDPEGYGRIIRDSDSGLLKEIVEDKDASEEVKKICEINSGTFCFNNRLLFEALDQIGNDNAQQEYYLTDTVKIMHDRCLSVPVVVAEDPDEVKGINSLEQLEELAQKYVDRV